MVVLFFCFTCERIHELPLETYPLTPDSTALLIELHYLPCLDYLSGLLKFGTVWLEAQEHYQKHHLRDWGLSLQHFREAQADALFDQARHQAGYGVFSSLLR